MHTCSMISVIVPIIIVLVIMIVVSVEGGVPHLFWMKVLRSFNAAKVMFRNSKGKLFFLNPVSRRKREVMVGCARKDVKHHGTFQYLWQW